MARNKNLKENTFKRAIALSLRDIIKTMSPTLYVKLQYKYITGRKLNLECPTLYTEKLQYLRLKYYPYTPIVSICSDKYHVRNYLKKYDLSGIAIKSYGLFQNAKDIDFRELPNSFIIKCTHGCAFNVIVKNKVDLNIPHVVKQLNKWLKVDYGRKVVEPHYSLISPRILIEELLEEPGQISPIEYKIHVFNGVAKYLYVVTSRGKEIKYNNYYIDWKPFGGAQFNGWSSSSENITPPDNYLEMVKIAETLGKEFPFVRVDLFSIEGKIYLNELTFTPAKGTLIFDDPSVDYEIGEWLKLPAPLNSK